MPLIKKESKVSLNIKISQEMDQRLKRARQLARKQGMMFNVSKEVEQFLEKELKKIERSLSLNDEFRENLNEFNLLSKQMKS